MITVVYVKKTVTGMSIALITKEKSLYLLVFDYIAYTVTGKYIARMGNAFQKIR